MLAEFIPFLMEAATNLYGSRIIISGRGRLVVIAIVYSKQNQL
ncbi:hypothetical protein MYVALT_G_01630 [Candidatus Vallotia tarda]|uniref:Uncharacterized protein n=1 Tax=Candidatus Vallotiella hemipterorum TaxID=1177213 RepID=A0A916JRD4_9BURK|nr:hypothetical protein MYVALT_G_01630 [Candidatus Vallotia tarda]